MGTHLVVIFFQISIFQIFFNRGNTHFQRKYVSGRTLLIFIDKHAYQSPLYKNKIFWHFYYILQGAKAIALALVNNTTVLKLNLADNALEAEGGQYIANMLRENCYITVS